MYHQLPDPISVRYRTLEDFEADVRAGTPRRRAIPHAICEDGRIRVNPEWEEAALEVAMVWMGDVVTANLWRRQA